MPLLVVILLIAILVAQIGFWDALSVLLGAAGMLLLLVLVLSGFAWIGTRAFLRQLRRG